MESLGSSVATMANIFVHQTGGALASSFHVKEKSFELFKMIGKLFGFGDFSGTRTKLFSIMASCSMTLSLPDTYCSSYIVFLKQNLFSNFVHIPHIYHIKYTCKYTLYVLQVIQDHIYSIHSTLHKRQKGNKEHKNSSGLLYG